MVRLTLSLVAAGRMGLVSIRFHRGGPSHEFSMFWAPRLIVSIRFHRGGPSHETNSQYTHGMTIVSIRFHRGGPSHET